MIFHKHFKASKGTLKILNKSPLTSKKKLKTTILHVKCTLHHNLCTQCFCPGLLVNNWYKIQKHFKILSKVVCSTKKPTVWGEGCIIR